MFLCPNCGVKLARTLAGPGVYWICPVCHGRAASVSLLRKTVPRGVVNELWQAARSGERPRVRRCPFCGNPMPEIQAAGEQYRKRLDVCVICHCVWFDPHEFEALPAIASAPAELPFERTLPQEAREKLALLEVEAIRERAARSDTQGEAPEEWWKWIPAVLGMPVEYNANPFVRAPLLTWFCAALIALVSVFSFSNIGSVIREWGLVPAQAMRYGGLTFITSFFIHAGFAHMLGNVYFLLVFGDNVEEFLGRWRFLLLLFLACLAGGAAHVFFDPRSTVPCVGASGAISGVIAFYSLKFPHARLGILLVYYLWFKWVRVPAYMLFLLWVALQLFLAGEQISGMGQISALAHLGGVVVGICFALLCRNE